jgi:hypothetical protein
MRVEALSYETAVVVAAKPFYDAADFDVERPSRSAASY